LGFSENLATRTLKAKVKRCANVLQKQDVLASTADATGQTFRKEGKGRYKAQFIRGDYFNRRRPTRKKAVAEDSPLYDPLHTIGFDDMAIGRILARFSTEQIQLWADVTLAALEHKGRAFFRRSPEAFFMNNIQHAATGERTPPDWFWAIRKQEQQRRADHVRQMRNRRSSTSPKHPTTLAHSAYRILDLDQEGSDIVANLTEHFLAAGQSEADARRNALRFADESTRSRRRKEPRKEPRKE
jgi:hypothetical protein